MSTRKTALPGRTSAASEGTSGGQADQSSEGDRDAERAPTSPDLGVSGQLHVYAATDVAAAEVLSKAAHGVQTAPDPDADVPLVNGWPQATYWHTVSQMADSSCPGQFEISSTWLGQGGSMVVANKTTGPISSNALSGCDNPTGNSVYPVGGYPVGVQLGGQIYTWSQWAALPTDPAKLWPIVQADANVGVAPGKGGITFTYGTIANALAQDPVSPAMREALFEVMEKIPGVTVSGQYTDSLGRTELVTSANEEP